MKIQAPSFSDRYKAQVEAERQYVLKTQQEDVEFPQCGEKHTRPPAASVEDAFHSIRKEKRSLTTES